METNKEIPKLPVLGTFEGECADSNITNKNGLDITREVWETVFNSDEYKQAIDKGWYIGFLGHPDDPGTMDFEHACIVMKNGRIEDSGKVYGSFDLIDTPVGRIVKSFQDAGVQFGISVRGAGDIIDNSVDPDTFVFRGFDLVSFPAYPDAIPTFTEVAASSDVEIQKKYKTICAAVKNNIDSLDTCEAVDIVQSQFAKQSDEYKMLEERKNAIKANSDIQDVPNADITDQKVEGLTKLYLKANTRIKELEHQVEDLKANTNNATVTANRKLEHFERIYKDQSRRAKVIQVRNDDIKASYKKDLDNMTTLYKEEQRKFKDLQQENLKYKRRVESADRQIEQKERIISSLNSKVSETVTSSEELQRKATNLDAKVRKLESKIEACQQIIQDYQDAYGNMYANALGVHIDNMSITASTSVEELQSIIKGAVAKDSITADSKLLNSKDDLFIEDAIDENDIVTL